jgi:hypothetical protein
LVREVGGVIQHDPFIQPEYPIYMLLVVQRSHHLAIIATGQLPAQLLRQIVGDVFVGLSHGPSPSVAYPSVGEESGPQMKASSYLGISGTSSEIITADMRRY